MTSLFTSPWGSTLLLLLALGLPVQLAIGGLVSLGRRIPATAVLGVPLLMLLAGLGGTLLGMEDAIRAIAQASDPAWAPWFSLDDRARAVQPAVLGGVAAALLAFPVSLGAAVAAVRFPARARSGRVLRAILLVTMLLYGAAVTLAGVGAALLVDGHAPLLLGALGTAPFAFFCVVAARQRDPARFGGVATGFGALLIASSGLALSTVAWMASGTAAALGDFSAPFPAMEAVIAATRLSWAVASSAGAIAVGFVSVGGLPLLLRDWRRLDAVSGFDVLAAGGVGLVVLLTAGWVGAQERVLAHLGGTHAAAVLRESAGYAVPRRQPIPARVLVGDAASPRWLMMRERGGMERLPIAGGLDIVGPAVLRNDGLMLAPSLLLEDLYLALFESPAGSVSIVGCEEVPVNLLSNILHDPLLAVGSCAAFPLTLRVTQRLEAPRVLIVLREGLVDDGGDVVGCAEITDVAGRDVIVRGQVDATVADLVAVLGQLAAADTVYLGHGVTLDGETLPIGVDPGLRIAGP